MRYIRTLKDSRLLGRLRTSAGQDALRAKDRDALVANIESVADHANWISAQITRFMPQYTLHNDTHIFNVLSIMEGLLPQETIEKLSPLECALCILAAVTHDLGMALSQKEQAKLTDESSASEERQAFVRHRSGRFAEEERQIARLLRQGSDHARSRAAILEGHILGDYLRRTHASSVDRISAWFQAIKDVTGNRSLFKYGNLDFEYRLALLAVSHNQEVSWLREHLVRLGTKKTDAFLLRVGPGESVNFAFPGLLLRLADIMDFDATRAPSILFHHIAIEDTMSIKEWQKHMAITGWELELEENPPRLVYEAANCEHPVFHKTICDFVREIEREARRTSDELEFQRRLLGENKGHVYRINIPQKVEPLVSPKIENGRETYIYHDLQFQLNQDEIQQLLMGEALYGNPLLAIRELLQNGLDALQLRDLRLKLRKRDISAPIEPTDLLRDGEELRVELLWGRDTSNGQEFIRVRDNGVGMTRHILETAFTQVGKSYYRSPEFARENALFRSKNLFATPISEFGIGILSCFMIGDRLEVRTCPGGADDFERRPFDLTISGPGTLFWLRPGTRTEQGTEVTLYLKPRFRIQTDVKNIKNSIRRWFGYKHEQEAEYITSQEREQEMVNLPLVAAQHFVWPMYPILIGPDGTTELLRLDDRFHTAILNPIDTERVESVAKAWGCSAERLGKLEWKMFDWIDEEPVPAATGSRIRLIFPSHLSNAFTAPCDPPVTSALCGQTEIAAFVETTLTTSSRSMLLVKGMTIEDNEVVTQRVPAEAGVGAYLWVDLRGLAAPKLTADRRKALNDVSVSGWREVVEGVFKRWIRGAHRCLVEAPESCRCWQHLIAWNRTFYPLLETASPKRIHIMRNIRPSWHDIRLWSEGAEWVNQLHGQTLSRLLENAITWVRRCRVSFDLDRATALVRKLYAHLDLTREIRPREALPEALLQSQEIDLPFGRSFDPLDTRKSALRNYPPLSRNVARAVGFELVLQVLFELASGRDTMSFTNAIEGELPKAIASAQRSLSNHLAALWDNTVLRDCYMSNFECSFLNEGFHPSLEFSVPALGCGSLRGQVGDALLAGPGIMEFAVNTDGYTCIPHSDEKGVLSEVSSYGYDLVFPFTCIPLARLRRNCPAWRDQAAVRATGVLPFLFWGQEGRWQQLAEVVQKQFNVPSILALMPRPDLWDKAFCEWTRTEWRTCGLSALWDLSSGKVLWATGAHTAEQMARIGKPIDEFCVRPVNKPVRLTQFD